NGIITVATPPAKWMHRPRKPRRDCPAVAAMASASRPIFSNMFCSLRIDILLRTERIHCFRLIQKRNHAFLMVVLLIMTCLGYHIAEILPRTRKSARRYYAVLIDEKGERRDEDLIALGNA